MIHKSKVFNGFSRYLDEEILPKLKGSYKYWLFGTVMGIALSDAEATLKALTDHPLAKMYRLVEGDMIDIEKIYPHLHRAAEKSEAVIEIPMIGPLTVTVQDVEKLYQYIRSA